MTQAETQKFDQQWAPVKAAKWAVAAAFCLVALTGGRLFFNHHSNKHWSIPLIVCLSITLVGLLINTWLLLKAQQAESLLGKDTPLTENN